MRQAEVDAARELVYRTAWLLDQGDEAVRQVSECKALVGELSNRVLYDCVQFHGGMGYMAESVVERMYRDVRINSIGGGATKRPPCGSGPRREERSEPGGSHPRR